MNGPHIHIILPVHNRSAVTKNVIDCLNRQSYRKFRIIVVDDGSTDGTSEMIKSVFPDSIFIYGSGNWWWGGSLQQGYKWLKKNNIPREDIVLIMNDDCTFENDFLQTAVDIMQEKNQAVLLPYAYSMQTGELIDKGVIIDYRTFTFRMPKENEPINCMSTRGLFLRMEHLRTIGGFRPIWLPHYFSDYEFTIRAGRKGFELISDKRLRLYMNEVTTGFGDVVKNESGFLKTYFSKKYTDHPLYTFNFIMLTFPFPYNFKFGFRVMKNTLSTLVRHFLSRKKA
jgi:GT2 family glycosyltransferase